MSNSFKVTTLLILFLAVLFIIFFFLTKQNSVFSILNPFTDDPYDAVGSFAIQLSFFTAIISLLRAFRPYNKGISQANQKVLLIRGLIISVLSVFITLITDIIAMLRYYSTWINLTGGQLLGLIVAGMTVLTLFTILLVIHLSKEKIIVTLKRWKIPGAFFICYVLIFSLYPSLWRQSLIGEIFTVTVGLLLSFLFIRITINPLFPLNPNVPIEDSLDDISAIYLWIKNNTKFRVNLFSLFDKLLSLSVLRLFISWINPRKHKWNFVIIFALFMGILITLDQILGEEISSKSANFILIIIIFLSFESAAVLLGYRLFAGYLRIFRQQKLPG